MKKVVITQSNYIPWKGYFDGMAIADEFILYDEVQYTRRDWRNRNKIKTPHGALWLTIPIDVKGKYLQKVQETKVALTENWREKHWKTIAMNYSKSPYFNIYKERFENLYSDTSEVYLSKINYSFLLLINDLLGIKTPVRWSSEFEPKMEGRNERLIDICLQTGATDYFSGSAAKDYMDENLFNQHGINVHYFDYSGYTPYNQLWDEFIHEVSIIDLIFNEGPYVGKYMKHI